MLPVLVLTAGTALVAASKVGSRETPLSEEVYLGYSVCVSLRGSPRQEGPRRN
jgi:hypothetical protein